LSVLDAVVAASAKRRDVVGNDARREAIAEASDLAKRIAMQNELAPLLMPAAVAAARRGSALAIMNAPRILTRMFGAHAAVTRFAASSMAADSLR
jgi:hypothetical protein